MTPPPFGTFPKKTSVLVGSSVPYETKEEFTDFYSSDNYVKDETTNLMMAPTTEEACKDNDGFVCKVRLGVNGML